MRRTTTSIFLIVAIAFSFSLSAEAAKGNWGQRKSLEGKRTLAGLANAYRNSQLSPRSRIKVARNILKAPISNVKRKAIHEAHAVGIGETGKNKKFTAGIKSDGTSNFTLGQLRRKARILKQADFTNSQIRALFDNGIAGFASEATLRTTLEADFLSRGRLKRELNTAAFQLGLEIKLDKLGGGHYGLTATGTIEQVRSLDEFLKQNYQ